MKLSALSLRKFVLSVAGICSLSIPFMPSAQANPYQQVKHFCKDYESVFVAAETKNFYVSICGSHSPYHYVGVSKKTGKAIRLPLTADGVESRGNYFEAVNGKYTYILANSTKGKNLTVSKGYTELLREPVLKGW